MIRTLADNWGLLLTRGVLAVLFGLLAVAWPGATLLAIAFAFGAYAFFDGIAALWLGLTGHVQEERMWPLALFGICGVAVGVVSLVWPGITIFALLSIVAVWAIVRGVMEIALAIRMRRVIEGEWTFGFSGLLSVLFGVLLFLMPFAGVVALVWLTAFYAILFGVMTIALALRLRGFMAEPGRFDQPSYGRSW